MEISQKEIFNRVELLLGEKLMQRFSSMRVIIFGVGGVGSWCAEGLVRNGVKNITIVDADVVCPSNINRQLMATTLTVGQEKVEALRNRLLEINPQANIEAVKRIYNEQTAQSFDLDSYDWVIDAIDSLKDKALLLLNAAASNAALLSSMGAALKVDPTQIHVAEFWNVRGCPLGHALRKRYKKYKTFPKKKFLCVYDEEVLENAGRESALENDDPKLFEKAQTNGSLVHITAIFGMTLCGLLIKKEREQLLKEQ